jgi:flagellin-like protein
MRYTETTDDSAVSPVIGVILMVAITVILAAVIGTFVLGLGDNVQETPTAAIESDQDQTQFALTIVSAGNIDSAQLTSPNGVRSTVLSEGLEAGAKLTVRSNATVFTFVDNNNVSILDAGTESPVYLN